MDTQLIFSILILIFSVIIHEIAHGYAALKQGDLTAKYQGRLSFNPLNHLDLYGSFIIPLITYNIGGFIFGWAKPVPINPYNFKNKKWGEAIVAFAGPLSNIIIAIFFAVIIRATNSSGLLLNDNLYLIMFMFVQVNLTLATFNLIPIPPLDGSKILFSVLPYQTLMKVRPVIEKYGFVILIVFVLFGWKFVSPIIGFEYRMLLGI